MSDTPKKEPKPREYYVEIGRRGGLIGGKRRAAALTPERRKEIARLAGIASAYGKPKKPEDAE